MHKMNIRKVCIVFIPVVLCSILGLLMDVNGVRADKRNLTLPPSGSRVTLQADNGLYLAEVHSSDIGVSSPSIKPLPIAPPSDIGSDPIEPLSQFNPIEAAKGKIDSSSRFVLTILENGKITLQAESGLYLSRINYGGDNGINLIEAAKTEIDPYSQFELIQLGNGKIALKADNGLYLSRIDRVDDGGGNSIEAAKTEIDPTCQFALQFADSKIPVVGTETVRVS